MITITFTDKNAVYTDDSKRIVVKVNNENHKAALIAKAKANAKAAGVFFKILGQLPNHYVLTEDMPSNTCPVHDTSIRKVYTFGVYEDAEVVTYQGCQCAVCVKHEDILSDATYHTSYDSAAGRAGYIKQSFNTYYRM